MRVLITGGAGFIGSITTRHLLDHGHHCVVLDTLERGWRDAVDPRAEFHPGSVGDHATVLKALAGCDAVMHLAGYIEVAESQRDPQKYFDNNVSAPMALLDAVEAVGIDAFVFSSTAAVYGEPEVLPLDEDCPTEPVNAYGRSKLDFELLLEERAQRLRSIRFRYFNVAGAWPDGSLGEAHDPETHIIPRILRAMRDGQRTFEVYGGDYPTPDGTCVRDYVHVVDLARAHRKALEHLHDGGEGAILNLGNGDGFSNLDVVHACSRTTGVDVEIDIGPRRSGDPAVLVACAQRAHQILSWAPEYDTLDEMVEHAWKWHLAHPNGYR